MELKIKCKEPITQEIPEHFLIYIPEDSIGFPGLPKFLEPIKVHGIADDINFQEFKKQIGINSEYIYLECDHIPLHTHKYYIREIYEAFLKTKTNGD